MPTLTSPDGTTIAYESRGDGPALVLTVGAFCDRNTVAPLAALLADRYRVYTYDRRGRGGSGDTPPYAVDREVEDLAAVIEASGGPAPVYGHSSGAALALEGALHGLPITALALYEAPYVVGGVTPPRDYIERLTAFAEEGRRTEAVEYWLTSVVRAPAPAVQYLRSSPGWAGMEALAHTLAYDGAIMGDRSFGGPLPAQWASMTLPTLVLGGANSPPPLQQAVEALAALLPAARREAIPGADHGCPPEVLAPILARFFTEVLPGTSS
ncbi:MAG TPA: alpha/beta hydrolase [Actinomycetota bacterium]|nr:alpha/beta hydrolase [Actinomycetota bacterium]